MHKLAFRAAAKTLEATDAQFAGVRRQAKEAEEQNERLRAQKEELAKELEALQARAEAGRRECGEMQREHDVVREEEAELLGRRYTWRALNVKHGIHELF